MKKLVCLVLAALMVLPAASCGNKEESVSTDSNKFTYWVDLPKHLAGSGMTFNDLPMYKEYSKRMGVEVEFIHPPIGQRNEKFNLMVASGNYPDIVEFPWNEYAGGVSQAVEDGAIIPLDGFMETAAPNLKKILDENPELDKAATTRTGEHYGFPRLHMTNDLSHVAGGLFLRKDWLDEVGMDVPETIDEWEAVLRAFKDKLGVKKPLSLRAVEFELSANGSFNNAFQFDNGFYVKGDKIAYGPMEPAFKDYIGLFARWYKEGLLDSEFAVVTKDSILTQVINGETGAYFAYAGNDSAKILDAKKDDPEFEVVGAPYPKLNKDDNGLCYVGGTRRVAAPHGCITKNCKNPELASKFLDYAYGDEGSLLYYYGIEGESYTMIDGVPTFTDLISNNPDGLSYFEAWARYARGYTSCIGAKFSYGTPEQQEQLKEESNKRSYAYQSQIDAIETFIVGSETRSQTLLPDLEYDKSVADEVAAINFEITTYVSENISRFILGDRPMSDWDKFIEELKSLKIEKLMGYMQDALDEYNNK